VQSTQVARAVLSKSPWSQLFAEAEASDTASSVASNVRRRVIVRQNLQHRRQARSELRRNVAPIQSSVHGQIQAEFATGSIERSPPR
jgi:hypothetical protein